MYVVQEYKAIFETLRFRNKMYDLEITNIPTYINSIKLYLINNQLKTSYFRKMLK